MPIFGQVWLWSSAAFLLGALLCWLLVARPARNRVGELEAELASRARRAPLPERPEPVRDDESMVPGLDDEDFRSRAYRLQGTPPPPLPPERGRLAPYVDQEPQNRDFAPPPELQAPPQLQAPPELQPPPVSQPPPEQQYEPAREEYDTELADQPHSTATQYLDVSSGSLSAPPEVPPVSPPPSDRGWFDDELEGDAANQAPEEQAAVPRNRHHLVEDSAPYDARLVDDEDVLDDESRAADDDEPGTTVFTQRTRPIPGELIRQIDEAGKQDLSRSDSLVDDLAEDPAETEFDRRERTVESEAVSPYGEPASSRHIEPAAPEFTESQSPRFGESGASQFGESASSQFGESESSQFGESASSQFGESESSQFGESESPRFGESESSRFAEPERSTPTFAEPGFGESEEPARFTEPERFSEPPGSRFAEPERSQPRFAEPERSQSRFAEQEAPAFGEQDRSTFAEQDRPAFGDQDRPAFGEQDRSTFGEQDRPAFGEQESPTFGDQDRPAFGEQNRPTFGEQDRPTFGEQDRPAFGDAEFGGFSEPEPAAASFMEPETSAPVSPPEAPAEQTEIVSAAAPSVDEPPVEKRAERSANNLPKRVPQQNRISQGSVSVRVDPTPNALPKRVPGKPRHQFPFGVQPSPEPAAASADAPAENPRALFEPIVPAEDEGMATPPPPHRLRQGSGGGRGPFGPGSAMPLPGGASPSPEFTIKASVAALRYCTPESPQFGRTVAEVWFRSAADAERVGFRPVG
ncbi:hypothetical protein [Actinophytocola sp.]|uniref:sunset domain-containing protein n=1 Tax=Actinophytocola sp. TaxID=1872138 RepID=UPI00389B09CB